MSMKGCIKLDVAVKRCPIVIQSHLSNFKVTRDKILTILTQIGRFRTLTTFWIHRRLWNDAQCLKYHKGGAPLSVNVICQMSRSQGTTNRRFWPQLSVSGIKLQFEFTDGFEMMHTTSHGIEEVPYSFSRSSMIFLGHTGRNKSTI